MALPVIVGLNAVIVAVTGGVPRILTVKRAGHVLAASERRGGEPVDSLPFGPLDPEGDRTLELGVRRWVREQTGLELGYVEQLYTFGDRHRDPAAAARVLSVAYLALVREGRTAGTGGAAWRNCYDYFPWEEWRGGRPDTIDDCIAPAIERWIQAAGPATARTRRERAAIALGMAGAPWDGERVLERYELLYEAGLVAEATRAGTAGGAALPGRMMAADHRRILATALGRLRGKLRYRPVVFELLPPTFTLLQLQRVVEALAGVRLHKQNFRRLVERGRLVEGTGRLHNGTGGRPAELFRFRREVLRERPAPGVGLPELRPAQLASRSQPG
ncbi:MAG TPA: hypothetical protein VG452_06930 [Egibacteraceae bacterium]|nr:hypothetical protein [Egibacteraceae bacterium]